MQDPFLCFELVNCLLNTFLEVKLELTPLNAATLIDVDGVEDLFGILVSHMDVHLLEHVLKLGEVNIGAVIRVDLCEQSSESDTVLFQSMMNFREHSLLCLENSSFHLSSSSLLVNTAWIFLHIDLFLVILEDPQEAREIDSTLLILVEVVDELVDLVFGDLSHFAAAGLTSLFASQTMQDILEVLSRQ